jgi:predicted TIM-barrel fold metal-dependent hydrolase
MPREGTGPDFIEALPVRPEVHPKILLQNALRVLGLTPPAGPQETP